LLDYEAVVEWMRLHFSARRQRFARSFSPENDCGSSIEGVQWRCKTVKHPAASRVLRGGTNRKE
jgi:hypothetical protein